jgi:hypothetical protein
MSIEAIKNETRSRRKALICMRCLLITTEIAITKLIKTASNSHIQN